MHRLLAVALVSVLLAGCASALRWEPDSYTVRRGDTLYGIAFRHGLDHRDVAAWNGLGRGDLIHPGQTILLSPPAGWRPASTPTAGSKAGATRTASATGSTTASTSGRRTSRASSPAAPPPSDWVWPTEGSVKSAFGSGSLGGKGIDISGRLGQPVRAAAAGEVVYSGSGLIGYGQLIIVKHNETFLSAYGHNSQLAVQEGDRVKAGEAIAQMGEGPGKEPVLHFEVRRDGKPVDPMNYLPRR
jgi:lipoprotein NlpD